MASEAKSRGFDPRQPHQCTLKEENHDDLGSLCAAT